ncbi:MAG: acylneuraminate cytidylyltransferase family protein [Synergistales bacterium]|nr:acylneuraminate cytidylyltransferase family protein [Synergistales bacterium]
MGDPVGEGDGHRHGRRLADGRVPVYFQVESAFGGKEMKDFCVIPARSGSKGLRDKNILSLGGKPVLAWTIESALKSGIFDDVIVATDSSEYARIAEDFGAVVPKLLPAELAEDHISSSEPLLYMLDAVGASPERVWCFQPTSPFRRAEDILDAKELFFTHPDTACVLSVTPVDPHFFHWALQETADEENKTTAEMWFGDRFLMDRSFLPTVFRPNGMIKAARTEVLLKERHFFAKPLRTVHTPEERSIHIRNALDMNLCRYLVDHDGI